MKTQKTKEIIQTLRQNGYRVFVDHLRFYNFTDTPMRPSESLDKYGSVKPKGGLTVVKIMHGDQLVASAEAKCSQLDQYNKKVGLAIALGRCIKLPVISADLKRLSVEQGKIES